MTNKSGISRAARGTTGEAVSAAQRHIFSAADKIGPVPDGTLRRSLRTSARAFTWRAVRFSRTLSPRARLARRPEPIEILSADDATNCEQISPLGTWC